VGATYEVEAKPSDPALGFGAKAKAEPFENPVLTDISCKAAGHKSHISNQLAI
jgi:hypothetical protein